VAGDRGDSLPQNFPARQSLEASQAIARLHGLRGDATIYARQHPQAIDAGVFHNDVACVGHRNVLLIHVQAWADQAARLDEIRARFREVCKSSLHVIEVGDDEITLAEAVQTYLFNSQIVTVADGSIALIAPIECAENPHARAVIDRIIAGDNPIAAVHFIDVRQSMRNGGGPACLRLRVTLTDAQLAAMNQRVLWSDELHRELVQWVERWYREELKPGDLADPKLLEEARGAQRELAVILGTTNLMQD